MHYMDMNAEILARAIGARVRQERKTRGWTLDQLAESAGLSRRMLVNVEQGAANPSVGTLLNLSAALGVGLPALVEPPARRSAKPTRSGEGAVLWTGEFGGQGVLVASTGQPDIVELWDWTLAPGDRHESKEHSAGTRELLQVHSGSVRVAAGGEAYELGPGDALSFHGDLPHSYAATGTEPARFSLAVFEPGAGSARRIENTHD
ncbi:helix-turn-helix domain-containing protein [Glutamicibacter endophyticus]